MPPPATSKPLITEVMRKPMPVTCRPARWPVAGPRGSAPSPGSAGRCVRMLPAMTPSISRTTSAQRATLVGSLNVAVRGEQVDGEAAA